MKRSGWADRAAGVLLASAAGDALGAGYEFTYPSADTPIAMIGGGPFGFEPGEWTDDTSMAVAVARVTATGVDLRTTAGLDAVAAGFAQWYASQPEGHRQPDPGRAVRDATYPVPRCSPPLGVSAAARAATGP